MTADRLREAADALDDRPPFLTVHQDRATADLLRAVDDADQHLTYGLPSCVTVPALALASTILGDTDG